MASTDWACARWSDGFAETAVADRHLPSRRAFMIRLAAMAGAAAGVSACGSEEEADGPALPATQEPLAGEAAWRIRQAIPGREPVVRVRVFRARGAEPFVELGKSGQSLRVAGLDEGEAVRPGPLEVRLGSDGWSVIDAEGRRLGGPGTETLEITADRPSEALLLFERAYPGTLRLTPRSDVDTPAFDVVNVVGMETYLPGVVAGELYDHWLLETRAAQAIAARSFASSECAHYRNRRAYDLTNTASSQVYIGRTGHETSLEAVRMTRGVVLTSEGVLLPGYYSSCCGGLAAAAADAIGPNPVNGLAPLRGRAGPDVCSEAVVARWKVERPVAALSRRLAAYGRDRRREDLAALELVTSIEAAATNPHGRPTRYAITDAGGRRVELSAEALRSAANHGTEEFPRPQRPLWSSHVTVTVDGDTAVFDGRGYGHGVGLCQFGAERLARSGKSHREILAWYYPGAELVEAY